MEKFHGGARFRFGTDHDMQWLLSRKTAQNQYQGYMNVTDPVRSLTPQCMKISQMLSRIGDKWSVLVIMHLRRHSCRFSELKREIGDISQRMLTLTLRNLERDGLVTRKVTPTIPPRVDYELTALGHSLARPVNELGTWVVEHSDDLAEAQTRFDAEDRTK